jgi:hypothetical protein
MPVLNPWLILGAFLTVIGVAAAGFGYGHHVEYLALQAYQKSQEAAAAKQVADNRAALLAQQTADFAKMAQLNQVHTGDLNAITQSRDALLAANRNLTQRLWVSVSRPSSGAAVPQAASGVAMDAQAGAAALDQRSFGFFVNEFSAADQLAADYAILQKVIVDDRRVCNGELPGAAASQ